MAEYKSFHYLMHKTPDAAVVHIVTDPDPLTFEELYSPRTDPSQRLLSKSEKSFWRTQDRVEFSLYEDRAARVLVVTAQNVVNKAEVYRTVFLDLVALYFELEAKAQGHRDPLTRKKNKILGDEALAKATVDFVLARLNIKADPLPWPTFPAQSSEQATQQTSEHTSEQQGEVAMERMCTFDRMASDTVQLEMAPPASYVRNCDSASLPAELVERLRMLPPAMEAVSDTVEEAPTAATTVEVQPSTSDSSTTKVEGANTDKAATSSSGEGKGNVKGTGVTKKKSSATVVPAQTGSGAKSSGKAGESAGAVGGNKSGARSRKVAPS